MMNHQVPILVASRRLGHSKTSVTQELCSHLYQESQNDVAALLDELVTPLPVEIPAAFAKIESHKIRLDFSCTIGFHHLPPIAPSFLRGL